MYIYISTECHFLMFNSFVLFVSTVGCMAVSRDPWDMEAAKMF